MRECRRSRGRLLRVALGCLLPLLVAAAPLAAQVEEAAGRGRAWLLSRQNLDGSFGAAGGLAPRDSGAAVLGLLAGGGSGPEVDRGLVYLSGVPERAAELRARRALALGGAGRPVAGLLDALGEFENGGGYGAFGTYESNLLDTALAVQALALEEEARLLAIVPLLDYLQLHQNADGGWGYVAGDVSRTYFTAETALALARLERLALAPQVLAAARSYLLGRQLADGSFGSALETALAYRALLALGADVSALPASPVAHLLATQAADGSWGGDVFTTGQVLVALGGEEPNLTVVEVAAAPESLLPGEAVTVTATVRNVGPTGAPASWLEVRAGAPDGEVRGEAAVPELAAGASHEAQVVVATADDAGELVLHAVADAREEVVEGDESDNTRAARVSLRTEPDLALFGSDLSVSPARPEPGVPFRLLVSARNQGETGVDSFGYRVSALAAGVPAEVLAEGAAGPAPPGAGALVEVPLTLPEGEYLLHVELDPAEAVAEAREDNNAAEVAFFVVDEDLPDLALAEPDLVATPARPAAGEGVSASATVRNRGAREATAAVELWDGEPGAGTRVASQTVTVPPGGARTVTAAFTAGADTVALVAVADPAGAVEERSEANNRARRFLVDRPDLAVGLDNLELSPLDPLEEETVQGAVTVRNAGTVAATAVEVAVYQGDPGVGAPLVFSGTVPELAPGANRTLAFTWTAAGGLHALTAVADPGDLVAELSEENNLAVRELAVPRAAGPNLAPSGVDLSGLDHSPATLAATGAVGVTIGNAGDADAGAFLVRLVEDRDGDARPSAADRELAVESVAAGVPAGGSAQVTLPVDTTFPFYRPLVLVDVDPTNLVPESREDDNRRPLFGACREAPPPASFEAIEEWYLPGLEVETAPAVVQLTDDDGDGRIDSRDVPDVVFHTEDAGGRAVTARSGLDGSEVWTLRSTAADPLEGRLAHLAAADLDGDGVAEVIAIRGGGRLVAIHHTGRILWVSDRIESAGGYNWGGGPAVGDLDGDGVPEIAVGRSVLSNTGRLLAQGTANVGRNHNYYGPFGAPYVIDAPFSVIADVDLDGRNELIAGDTLYRLEGGVLQVVWDRTVPDKLMIDGYTAVGNLDADPQAEIVYVSSNKVMVLNHDGTIFRDWRLIQPLLPFGDRTYWAGPPSIGDLDGDGTPEILVAASHQLYALRANLSTLWRVPTTDFSEKTVAVPFDLDGDGADEVLFLDHTTFRILDGATGATLYSRPNTSKTLAEAPVVVDVDGDGRAEVLVPSNRSFGGDRSTQGLHVLGHPSWRGTRMVWNQHTHRGTNVQADGTVPSRETPPWLAGAGFRTNLELPAPERLLPNLTVSLPRVGRAGAEGVPVVVRVGNGGLATVPPGARVALYAADPAGGAEPVAEGATAGALRPGAFEDVTLLWQVAGAAGEPAWAAVDPADAEAECAEDDNLLAFTVEESVLPDVAVPAGGVTVSGPLAAGQRVPVAVRVGNAGAASAWLFTVRVFDGEPALGRVIGEATVEALAPGESEVVEVPWETLGALPGRHALHAVADAGDVLLETTEENNRGLLEVDLASPGLPDLSVESFTVTPAAVASGETATFRAELRNRGAPLAAGFAVAFRVNRAEVGRVEVPEALGTGESRTVELPWSTAGRQGLLAVEVAADPAGVVAEVAESNNLASAELAVTGATLSVAVATGRASYTPGDTVALTVTAASAAADPRAAELRVGIVDAAGARVAEVASQAVTLPPGATPFELAWETASAPPGAYSAVAELLVVGAAVARGQVLFSLARQVAVTAALFTDRDLYPAGASAVLTGRVANASGSTLLSTLTARTAVVGPGGAEVFAATTTIPVLYPGSEQRIDALWPVGSAAPGAYTATLSVRDGAGLLVAFTSAPLAVEDSASTGAGIRGELAVAPDPVGAGAPLLVDFRVENRGNADLPELALRVDLLKVASGQAAASVSLSRALDRGAAVAESFALDTGAVPAGDYLAALVASLPGTEVTLDRAGVAVAPGISVGDAAVAEGDAGTALLRFPVRLSEALAEPVTVDYATADGTAAAGSDFQATAGTLTLAAGETEAVVEVPVFGDLDPEPDEVLVLSLADPSAVLPGRDQALGTIHDEEGCASPDLLANGAAEGGSFSDPMLGWSEAGAAGWRLRFAAPTPLEGRAAFAAPAAATSAELVQTVDLAPFAARIDAGGQAFLFEGFLRSNEEAAPDGARVVVEYLDGGGAVLDAFESGEVVSPASWQPVTDLRTPPAGTRAARVRLVAARAAGGTSLEAYFDRLALRSVGTPTLVVGDGELLEGDAGSSVLALPVSLSCALAVPVSVDFATADGSAVAGADYQATSGTLTLAAGETAAAIEVPVLGDTLDEPDEAFAVAVSTPDEPVVLRPGATATIRDDDGPAVLSVADLNVSEGDDGAGEAVVTVSLSAVSGKTVTAAWSTGAGTAGPGTDYQSASGTVTLPAGETTATITVPILGDRLNEPGETFAVALARPQAAVLGAATGTVTILDDDPVEIRVGDARAVEGDAGGTAARFAVSLSVPSVSEVSVAYATSDLDALAGVDYQAASGTLAFAPGETAAEVAVAVLGDTLVEPVESFLLTLAAPAGGHPTATLADPEAVGAIVDDDGILLSVADATVREGAGAEAVFRVTLNKATTVDVSADFATLEGSAVAGVDFQAATGTVTLPAGAVTAEVRVPVVDDALYEPPQDFRLALSNPSGEAVLLDPEAEATILDDDGWALNSSAEDTSIPGCIVLTPPINSRRGTAWRKERIDLTESFDKTFRIYVGDKDGNGGEGIYFALQSSGLTALGASGGSLGYLGIRPSIGFEIDTVTSTSFFGGADHMSVGLNGSEHAGHAPVELPAFNVEDGEEHELRVTWNAATKTFDLHFDGVETLVYPRDVVASPFGGQAEVFWGLTGGTGSRNNLQYFCDTARCFEGGGPPSVSVGDAVVTEGDSGTSQLHFPVTLSCPSDQAVTVSFATEDGTATAGADYLHTAGTLTFAPGETAKDLVVEVVGEEAPEVDEELTVALSGASRGVIRHGRGVGTIVTDDIGIEPVAARLVEGDAGSVRHGLAVRLTAPAPATVQVPWRTEPGSAVEGVDYTPASGTLTFGKGATEAVFAVSIQGDLEQEPDRDFFVVVEPPAGSRLHGGPLRFVIADDDACPGLNLVANPGADLPLAGNEIPGWTEVVGSGWRVRTSSPLPQEGTGYFFAGPGTAAELAQVVDLGSFASGIDGGGQAFLVRGFVQSFNQSPPDTSRIIVEWMDGAGGILGSWTSGAQNDRSAWRLVGTVAVPPTGTRAARIRLVSLRNAGSANDGYFDSIALVPLGQPLFLAGDTSAVEGSSGGAPALFEVSLNCAIETSASVDYLTVDGTARAGSDYQSTFGTLTFAPGEVSKTVEVQVLGDTLDEGDEDFFLELAGPVNAALGMSRGRATIVDDESVLAIGDVTALEGDAEGNLALFPVTLAPALDQTVRVDYATADGTAVAGSDYEAASGTLTFEPGETRKTVAVQLVGDAESEPDETFVVRLSNPLNAVLGDAEAIGTVVEDDIRFSVGEANAVEGHSGTTRMLFDVTLASPVSRRVTVRWRTEDAVALAGVDYQAASGVATFDAGRTLAQVAVNVLGDTEIEGSETFLVRLEQPSEGRIEVEEAAGLIVDDDDCPSDDLLVNGGAEQPLAGGELPGWTEVVGNRWTRATGGPGPLMGQALFWPGDVPQAELSQDVDVSDFAPFIDAGIQRFLVEAFIRSHTSDPDGDPGRMIVEYLDETKASLAESVTEEVRDRLAWTRVFDLQTAPAGTRWIRVRLLARIDAASGSDTRNNVYFDAVGVSSLGTPTVAVDPLVVAEGDGGVADAPFELRLSCAAEDPVTVGFATVDGTALAGQDYLSVDRTVVFAPGETSHTVAVPVVGDLFEEPDQDASIEITSTANAPRVRRATTLSILDDDPPPFLSVDDVTVAEGAGEAVVRARLSVPSEIPVQFFYGTGNGTAVVNADYLRRSGNVVFAPFQQVAEISIPIVSDAVDEPDETFRFIVHSPNGLILLDGEAQVTILDDDAGASCDGPDLLVNGSGDRAIAAGGLPGWTVAAGDAWGRRTGDPAPVHGFAYLAAGTAAEGELVQDLDLSAYGVWIDTVGQEVRFAGSVRSRAETVPDRARIVVEYRDGTGGVLDAFDSGWTASSSAWQALADTRTLPPGTRTARVRLLAARETGETTDAYFDRLSLRTLGTPTLWVEDVFAQESPLAGGAATFRLRLSCPAPGPVSVAYATADGSAVAGTDYEAAAGTLIFEPGELLHEVEVAVLDDAEADPAEHFELTLELTGDAALVTPRPRAYVSDDDGVVLDLALCLDTSGSVSFASSVLQANGTAAAVEDPSVVPHNGTVRLSVLRFASGVQYSVPPVIVDRNNAAEVAARIRTLIGTGGGTNMEACLDLATRVISQATPFSAKQVIDVSTDGFPNNAGATLREADEAVAAGIDVINAIGVGANVGVSFLRQMVRPQPAGGPEGFVVTVGSFTEYADAIAQKIRKEANPDLVVTKTDGRDEVTPGEVVEYTITVTNTGSGAVASVVVEEALPAALLDPVFTPSVGTFDPATGAWSGVGLDTGGSITLTVTAQVDPAAAGTLVNTVTVSPPEGVSDLEPADNTATDTTALLARADLAVAKSHDGPFAVGVPGLYRLRVTNLGPSSAAGPVRITDTLPAGLAFAAATGDGWTCAEAEGVVACEHAGPLLAGQSLPEVALEVTVDAAAVPEVTNVATVSSATEDPEPANDTASDLTPVEGPAGEPELTAAKTDALAFDADGDGVPSPGDEIGYEIVIANTGGAPATGVVLRDLPPLRAAIVSGSVTTTAGLLVTEDPVEVDLGTLEPGASVTVAFRVAVDLPVPAGTDRISNQGTVTSAELPAVLTDDPELGGDADPTVTMLSAAPELVAEKTDRLAADHDGDGAVSPGDEIEYAVTLRNVGNTSATDVLLLDPVPEHTALVEGSVVAPEGVTIDEGDPVRVALGELAGGASAEVRFRVRIENPIAAGVREVVNQALVTSAELPDVVSDDPEVDGPADATVTPVSAAPELRVEKGDTLFEDAGGDGVASPGDVLLYRVTVANSGNTAATSVVLTDPVPEHAALEPATVQASQGAVVLEDPVTVELGEVPAGTEAVVTFRVRIASPFPLDVLAVANQAEVASTELDPVASDDPETAEEGDPTVTEVFITPEVTVDDVTVEETAGPAVFIVTLSEPSNRPVQVPYATTDGPGTAAASPATAGLDYLPAGGTVTLAPGETTATVAVEVLDDLLDELDEIFTLVLGEPEGGLLLDGEGVATVLDDDPPPFVSVGDATVVEGDPGDAAVELVFPVTLSGPSGLGIAVDFATAPAASGRPAEPGVDFVEAAGTLGFPPGTTAGSITVAVVPDLVDELDETFRVVLSNPLAVLLADAEGVGTIRDDDEARISIGDVTVPEGDSGVADALFPVRLAVPADRDVTVRYRTVPGTAAETLDYLPVSGVLAFPAGTTEAAIAVPVVGDVVLEPLEETFTVELSDPTETTMEDPVGVGTIVDDEECPGPNLLRNPGAEARPLLGDELGELPAWLEVEGTTWRRRFADPDPAEGAAYFFAGEADLGELAQEVSVRAYEVRIDGGLPAEPAQRFAFAGRVRTYQESPPDTARVVVEYRDRTNTVVLDAFDSGEISSPEAWQEVSDTRAAPAGTGWVRVRLVATRFAGQSNDGYFDDLSLRSLRVPTLTVSDVAVYEGDSGETPAPFTVALSCPYHLEVGVSYRTADGPPEAGATAGSDYRPVAGSLTLPPGETEATVPVPVLGDTVHERHEIFYLELSDAAPAGDVVLLDPRGEGLIVNDDFCPRSPGFWKTHEELWPTDWLVIGGVEYGAAELAAFLDSKGGDQTLHLVRQLVATKLNLLVGSDPEILPVVEDADAFLAAFPPGSDPKGEDRRAAETLKNALDAYNNSPCEETPVVPE